MKGINISETKESIDVSFDGESINFNVNDLELETIRTIELAAFEGVAGEMYSHILAFPFIKAVLIKEFEGELDECDYLSDYLYNMKEVRNSVQKFNHFAEKGAHKIIDQSLDNYIEEARKSCKEVLVLIDKILPYFEIASKVEQIDIDDLSKETYLKLVTNFNKKAVKAIEETNKYAKETEGHFLGDPNYWGEVANIFSTIMKNMDVKYLEKDLMDEMISDLRKVPASAKSEAEIERENYINKANDLYQQLCLDWMRDLKEQIPYSVKDRYEAYMNKFQKFNNTFEMPLSKTTGLGKAKEACSQINNLMNYITDISSEAYTTSVYDEK